MGGNIDNQGARDIASLLHPFTNLALHEETGPLIVDRGQGVHVYDTAGRRYIEGLAGLWCASFGFGEEELIKAAVDQMRRLPYYHGFGHKSSPPSIELAERLKAIAPGEFSHVFFTNSGSEANDTVVKLVWYYNNARGKPEKKKIIARERAYHGVTVMAGSLTGLPVVQNDFDLPVGRILRTGCPHYYRNARAGESEAEFTARLAAELEELILEEGPETVAAFFAEPVMGAGGVILPPEGYFPAIRKVLDKYDILLVADEVICGFGRTGNMWGCDSFDIRPDILTCAKQLSSAYMPIAAVLLPEKMYQAFVDQSRRLGLFGHGFTYSGHPTAAAVALRTLSLMEERDLLGHVQAVMPRFQQRLQAFADHPLVGEVRGIGLIGAVELVADKDSRRPFDPAEGIGARVVAASQRHGLLHRALGDSIAFCPPLIITEEEIDAMFDSFTLALDEIHKELQFKREG